MNDDVIILGELIQKAVESLVKDGAKNGPQDIEELGITFVNSKGDTYFINITKNDDSFICDVTVLRKSGGMVTLYQEKIARP